MDGDQSDRKGRMTWQSLVAGAVIAFGACLGAPAQPQQAVGPGDHRGSITVGGMERTFRFHVPPTYERGRPVPLVLAFHGRAGTGRSMERLTGFNRVADSSGFIVVYPDGVNRSWNAGYGSGRAETRDVDDVAFVDALIDEMARTASIDRRRVYATGMSNGAMLASRLACELSGDIAAVAIVAGSIGSAIDQRCAPQRPVSVLQIQGTDDRQVPMAGGQTAGGGEVLSASAAAGRWAERNRCATTPTPSVQRGGVRCQTYAGCGGGADVVLCSIEGGGHTWPGGPQYLPRAVVGATNRDIDASVFIWDFFQRHTITGP
jgi:polyhydroxybutyrate depolymerase